MDRLSLDRSRIGHLLQRVRVVRAQPDLGQGRGQAHASRELDEVTDVAGWGALEDELRHRADVDFLSVHQPVGHGHRGQPVVDGVCGREAAGLEAKAGQQRIGFDHLLHGRRHLIVHDRVDCRDRALPQHVPAQLGQRRAGYCGQPACHGLRVRPCGRAGLQPGRQGIADPGDEERDRSVGYQLRVDQDQLGIAGEEPVLLELSFLGVDDGQRAAWSVSGRDGRAVGPADPGKVPSRLDRVDRAASAQRDGDVGARLLDDAG